MCQHQSALNLFTPTMKTELFSLMISLTETDIQKKTNHHVSITIIFVCWGNSAVCEESRPTLHAVKALCKQCKQTLLCMSVCLSVCRFCTLVQQKEKWEEQEGRGRKEKEELNQQIQKNRLLQQENLQLKTEVDRYCVFIRSTLFLLYFISKKRKKMQQNIKIVKWSYRDLTFP